MYTYKIYKNLKIAKWKKWIVSFLLEENKNKGPNTIGFIHTQCLEK